jgi:hypothetical protein
MLQSISTKSAGLLAVLALACMATMPFSAAAETEVDKEYTEEEAVEMLAEATEAVEEAQAVVDAEETDRGEYMQFADAYVANAQAALEDEDYTEVYEQAEHAVGKAEYILGGDEVEEKDEEKAAEKSEEKIDEYYEKDKKSMGQKQKSH